MTELPSSEKKNDVINTCINENNNLLHVYKRESNLPHAFYAFFSFIKF